LSNGKAKLKEGMFLYCPSHGIGKILAIETKEYLGEKLSFCNMEFKQDDMKMLIPINKMKDIGIRQIISKEEAKKVLETVLDKPAKNMKSIWSKRMVEYALTLKIKSLL
jgi:CarD family transcriptional regulator